MYIFVYGTLKRGCSKHLLMKGANFICQTHTKECFAMLDMGSFPGVIKDRKVSRIHGELYSANGETGEILLERLDHYEGSWYSREIIELGNGIEAWMYFLKGLPRTQYTIVTEGEWDETRYQKPIEKCRC